MAQLTKAKLEQLRKLAREAAGIPEAKTMGELAREHLAKAVEQVNDLAQRCPIPEVRLKASTALIELAKLDQDDSFTGDSEALDALMAQPLEQRRMAALQLFANGSISKRDMDVVLAVINGDQAAQINMLLAQNQRLEKALTDATAGNQGRVISGRANGKDLSGLQAPTVAGDNVVTLPVERAN